jgi:hypothetical protein
MSMSREQAQKWWDYVGMAMVLRGEVSKQIDPFKDIFDLQYQSQSAAL